MHNGVVGHPGLLVQQLVAKIQQNTRHEFVTIHRQPMVKKLMRLLSMIALLFLCVISVESGCPGSGYNVTTCSELPDCPGKICLTLLYFIISFDIRSNSF